ncbi:FLNC-like protein [Mya arenaria]|uniref:FLNC-like protein n=1 Tax=Mya arenaria TaxID=6604 RepID=A0ABY7G188_MYAAR|nr:FLNC-like protein [Mya arenaria]
MSSVTQIKLNIKPSVERGGIEKLLGNSVGGSGRKSVKPDLKVKDKSAEIGVKVAKISADGVSKCTANGKSGNKHGEKDLKAVKSVKSEAYQTLKDNGDVEVRSAAKYERPSVEVANEEKKAETRINYSKVAATDRFKSSTSLGVRAASVDSKPTKVGNPCVNSISPNVKRNEYQATTKENLNIVSSKVNKEVQPSLEGVKSVQSESAHSKEEKKTFVSRRDILMKNDHGGSDAFEKRELHADLGNESSRKIDVIKVECNRPNNDRKNMLNVEKVTLANMVENKEKKVTNLEREKMLLHQGIKDFKFGQRKAQKVEETKEVMDLEKNLDLGDEVPSVGASTNDVSGSKNDVGGQKFEPGNMMDELQKYLLKRFGQMVPVNLQTEEKRAVNVEKAFDKDVDDVTDLLDSAIASGEGNNETKEVKDIPEPPKLPSNPKNLIQQPIFFKTSIKKDPGSKLHDQLIKELGQVMRKKEGKGIDDDKKDDNDETVNDKGVKFPKRRVSATGNKILANKALLASLESQLQRTLHKNKIFQKQLLKVVDLQTVEVADDEEDETKNEHQTESASHSEDIIHKPAAKLILDTGKIHRTDSKRANTNHNISASTNSSPAIKINSSKSGAFSPVIKTTVHKKTSIPDKTSVHNKTASVHNKERDQDNQEVYVYAFQHPSGRTEGIVCSVERRESTRDSLGRPRKYLTCINIVGEKDAIEEGCPYTQVIADGGMPTASGSGLFFAEEDKPASFNVDVGRRKGDLRVAVSGSPYHPKVVDVRKVRIIGGWQHFMDSNERVNLVVGERKQLPFEIAEAGPGVLRAEVKGPSRSIDASVDNHTMGSHYIYLFWSDLPLVNSPFLGYAIQQVPDASKLILTGRGLKEATVREEAEFIIDGSQAGKGSPDVVLSGVRTEVNVKVSPLGNGKFRCTYIPTVPGAYLLHITWNGRQLRGSPYKVNVIGAFYPNRVVVTGEGLRSGTLGLRSDVLIDTRKAGPGELTAYCMGPHQAAFCELGDNKDGTFNLGIKSQESGRHVLEVKYGGEHVQGSPFVFKVTSKPDASKVRVHGPGVEHGILATFQTRFIVETRGAGAGQLTVRIRGPKGAFQVEMYRDSQRDRTILCRFDPTECGLYIISVKWSGVDVPGSPFHVHILDTQEELEQYLSGSTMHYIQDVHGIESIQCTI